MYALSAPSFAGANDGRPGNTPGKALKTGYKRKRRNSHEKPWKAGMAVKSEALLCSASVGIGQSSVKATAVRNQRP